MAQDAPFRGAEGRRERAGVICNRGVFPLWNIAEASVLFGKLARFQALRGARERFPAARVQTAQQARETRHLSIAMGCNRKAKQKQEGEEKIGEMESGDCKVRGGGAKRGMGAWTGSRAKKRKSSPPLLTFPRAQGPPAPVPKALPARARESTGLFSPDLVSGAIDLCVALCTDCGHSSSAPSVWFSFHSKHKQKHPLCILVFSFVTSASCTLALSPDIESNISWCLDLESRHRDHSHPDSSVLAPFIIPTRVCPDSF